MSSETTFHIEFLGIPRIFSSSSYFTPTKDFRIQQTDQKLNLLSPPDLTLLILNITKNSVNLICSSVPNLIIKEFYMEL